MSDGVKRILLVEPEPTLAEVTAFRLELLGYRVQVVRSAEEALQQVSAVAPDLVITDLALPRMDGTGLIERLASEEETSDVPVMVLSTEADLDQVQAVYGVGARDFLVVPFQMEVLEEKVVRHTARPREKKREADAIEGV